MNKKTFVQYLHKDDYDFYYELIEKGFSEEEAEKNCYLFYEVGIKRWIKDWKAYIIWLVKNK